MILGSQITVPTFSSQWILFTLSCRCLMICVGRFPSHRGGERERIVFVGQKHALSNRIYSYTPMVRGNNEKKNSKLALQTRTRACWRARYLARTILILIWCNPTLRSPTVEPTGRTHTIQGLWITILSVFSFRSSCAYIYLGMTRTVPESCQWGEDEGLLYKLELAVQVRTIDLSLPPRTHRAFPRLRA